MHIGIYLCTYLHKNIYAHIYVKLVVSYFYNKKANILEFFLSWNKNIAKICYD